MASAFQVNDLIGEYRVTSFLGEGGMGEVYLGAHQKLGRMAAIKILGAAALDESFKTRFFNEARLQASLHHPNIATLYDFREDNDRLLIFMEFIDGESLEDLVERRCFTVDDALTVFASICEAVAYIHQNGIVHRDIKSQNVKLTSAGTAKLLDFGIAKDAASHGLTQTGGVIGTPNYLSPEQLEGKPATSQSDVWALGVLLYEMLTGSKPFDGETLGGLVLQITLAQFDPPEKINPAVPREAANLVRRCLKKDAAERFRNADELLDAVRSVIDGKHRKPKTLRATLGLVAAKPPEAQIPGTMVNNASDYAQTVNMPPKAADMPWALIVAAGSALLLVVIAISAVGIWALSGSSSASKVNDQTQSVTKNVNSRVAADPKVSTQRIRVDIDEGKAEVFRDGKLYGTTPVDVDIVSGEIPKLTLRRIGFEDKEVTIEAGSGKKVFTFSLKPVR